MKKQTYKYESACCILDPQKGQSPHALILGDAQAPLNKTLLQKHSIGVIISIGKQAVPTKKFNNIKYHLVDLRDQKDQPIANHFEKVTDLLQDSLLTCSVLIHCYHGVSRSASFVIAYMMRKNGWGFEQAKEFVKQRRPCISPNEGFVKQLILYEGEKPLFMTSQDKSSVGQENKQQLK